MVKIGLARQQSRGWRRCQSRTRLLSSGASKSRRSKSKHKMSEMVYVYYRPNEAAHDVASAAPSFGFNAPIIASHAKSKTSQSRSSNMPNAHTFLQTPLMAIPHVRRAYGVYIARSLAWNWCSSGESPSMYVSRARMDGGVCVPVGRSMERRCGAFLVYR